MSDLYSLLSQCWLSNKQRKGDLVHADTGSTLEGANTPPLLGTTEEENSNGKDGGAGRLRNKKTEVVLFLGVVSVFHDYFFAVTMAHRYLRLSSGCRNVFRLLLAPKVVVRQVGRKQASMVLSGAAWRSAASCNHNNLVRPGELTCDT